MAPQRALATASVLLVLLGASNVTALTLSGSGQRPPGEAGLVRHSAGSLAGKMRVFVIVRTYRKQVHLIERLVGSLRNGSDSQVDTTFLLLPTESEDVAVFRDLAKNLSSSGLDVKVPWFLRPEAYVEARKDVTQCGCPPEWHGMVSVAGQACYSCPRGKQVVLSSCSRVHKEVCVYENEVHYRLTDRAMDYAMKLTQEYSNYSKTSILVTNGDNVYRKSFLAQMMDVPQGIAISDFVERPEKFDWQGCSKASVNKARIDLGAYIVDTAIIRQHNVTFSNSIPSFSPHDEAHTKRMWAFHDADFWFIHNLVLRKRVRYTIIHECMFSHVRHKKPILHMDADHMAAFIS